LYNGKFGTWLFLASEVMLFGALFSAYIVLRVTALDWPEGHTLLSVPLATLNTVFLITSSVTMVLSWGALKVGDFSKGRKNLVFTIALAGAFLVVKGFEYTPKLHHYQVWLTDGTTMTGHLEGEHVEDADHIMFVKDAEGGDHPKAERIELANVKRLSNFGPGHSNFLAVYWTLTGLHGLHIVGGIIVIAFLAGPGAGMWKTQRERYTNRVECTGLYWHFVDLVWIFLFPVLYLL
jgi:cytochrome c oxidase subunit 3